MRRLNTMDKILLIVGILYTAFIVTMICIFQKTGLEPATLIVSVTGVVGGECGIMGWIKTTKERREQRAWDLEDEERREKHD